jgi:hypothetical protein
MDHGAYTKVTQQQFDAYPGEKIASGTGAAIDYMVRGDEVRPVSDRVRSLADRFAELLIEEGLMGNIETGGLPAQLTIDQIANALVTVVDENLPQYARKAVVSFSQNVATYAQEACAWSVGCGQSSRTISQLIDHPEPSVSSVHRP